MRFSWWGMTAGRGMCQDKCMTPGSQIIDRYTAHAFTGSADGMALASHEQQQAQR
jgi:hypothetical protein